MSNIRVAATCDRVCSGILYIAVPGFQFRIYFQKLCVLSGYWQLHSLKEVFVGWFLLFLVVNELSIS